MNSKHAGILNIDGFKNYVVMIINVFLFLEHDM